MNHLEEHEINDFADDLLPPDARATADDHLAACGDCAAAVARVRELRAALGALPRDVAPPAHLFAAVHTRIASQAATAATAVPPRGHALLRPRFLAAAAVLLIAVSSATTALLLRDPGAGVALPSAGTAGRTGEATPGGARLVGVQPFERAYEDEIAQLQRLLATDGGALAPATMRVIEHNLGVIDAALSEAREALAADPANDALTELLRSGYERKLDVLRSATALGRARS
jgi:anti-sigma factor RsiW